jgi:hypothetical protein
MGHSAVAARTLALLLLFAALRAEAHSNDAQIVLEGNRARLRVAVRSDHLARFDRNHDGLISAAEIDENFTAMNQWLDARMPITDHQNRAPRIVFSDLAIPNDALSGSTTVTIVRTYEWERAPKFAILRIGLDATPENQVFRIAPTVRTGQAGLPVLHWFS